MRRPWGGAGRAGGPGPPSAAAMGGGSREGEDGKGAREWWGWGGAALRLCKLACPFCQGVGQGGGVGGSKGGGTGTRGGSPCNGGAVSGHLPPPLRGKRSTHPVCAANAAHRHRVHALAGEGGVAHAVQALQVACVCGREGVCVHACRECVGVRTCIRVQAKRLHCVSKVLVLGCSSRP